MENGVEDGVKQGNYPILVMLRLHRNTRSSLLPYLLSCMPFTHQLCMRFLQLLQTVQKSGNSKMKWLVQMCPKTGNMHANMTFISNTWQLPLDRVKLGHARLSHVRDSILLQRSGAIIDFMDNLNADDVMHVILQYLCTF